MPSSVIKTFRYAPSEEKLTIVFVSGVIYEYLGVPADIWRRFEKAFSKGRFFSRYIRDRYRFNRIGS